MNTDTVKTYKDIEIIQNIDMPMRGRSVVVQNVNVQTGTDLDSVVTLIRQYGGVQNFIRAIYSYVIQQNRGNLNQAADTLMIQRQTLSEYRKKYLLSDGK